MISLGRPSASRVTLALALAVLAVLMVAGVPRAFAASSSRLAAAEAHHPVLTPIGHPSRARQPAAATSTTSSPWTPLKNAAPFFPDTMLLASDGTVLVHAVTDVGDGTANWYKLTPNSKGSYVDGTWSELPPMPGGYDPLYFASAILPDGRMIVEGGEYLGGTPTWTNRGAIYNPRSNSWRTVAPPQGWANIGDSQSDILNNGTFMMAQACQNCTSSTGTLSTADALFNAANDGWNPFNFGKNDPNDEEGWTLEPSGQLLTVDTWLTPNTELFNPHTLNWTLAGNTVGSPVNAPNAEIGPQNEVPGGNTFVVGAGSGPSAPSPCTTSTPAQTALYNYAAGAWSAGPTIPTTGGMQYDSADGPGATLPDGHVLFDVSPCVFNPPIKFYAYNPSSNTLSAVPDVPSAANDSTFYTRLLVLPNGQVLFNDESSALEVYTAGGTPNPSWAPSVSGLSSGTLAPGKTYGLAGSQLAGLDQGSAYGDDVQNNTNFPLARVTNSSTGIVTYARTTNWSSVSVAPGTGSTTDFTVPASTPTGASSLVVIANGIASSPVPVTIK